MTEPEGLDPAIHTREIVFDVEGARVPVAGGRKKTLGEIATFI